MEIKRSFSEADWLATPKPVHGHIETLEQIINQNSALISKQEKRIDELESRLNKNSKNSSKSPSSDSPYDKSSKDGAVKTKKKNAIKVDKRAIKGIGKSLLSRPGSLI